MVFQPGSLFSGASVLRHTVIENPSGINATAHPIIVEDALIRHDPALVAALAAVYESSGAGCGAMFEIEQHAIAGIAPSRVARTVIDGLGGPPSWWSALLPQEFDAGCPALRVLTSAETPPLVISARVINSRGPGVGLVIGGLAKGNETLLTDCEISGSEWVGMYVAADPTADSLPRVTSCNVFGNARDGVVNWAAMQLDARGNWWGDPTGPQGPQGDGVARFGEVDANDPLAAPVGLDY
jgi:hypothetical protein